MRFPQGWELIVVLAVVLLLFGSKKLPDAARGLGRSLRIFKSEIKTMQDDDAPTVTPSPTTIAPAAETPSPSPAPPATPTQPSGQQQPPRADS